MDDTNPVHRDLSTASVPLQADATASATFRAVLLDLLDTMELNWSSTIADVDTEFLHDLRIAVRRTRSILGHAKHVLPESMRARYRGDFAWLAGATGRTRDLDVYALEWPSYVAELSTADTSALAPVLEHVVRHRRAAHAELVSVLQSERAVTLLADWRVTLLTDHADGPSHAGDPLGTVLAKRFCRAHRRVLEQGRKIDADSPAEALHELRKDAKKLRYLVECFGPAMPGKPLRRFVQQLKELQDNLGRHQDAAVHADELSVVAAEMSDDHAAAASLIALAALTERLDETRRAARAEFADRFAAYDSRKTEHLVTQLIEALRRAG